MDQIASNQGGQEKPPEQQPPAQQQPGQQQPKGSNKTVLIIVAVVVVFGIVALVGGYFVMRGLRAKVSETIGQKMGENMLEKAIEQGTGQKADVSADGKTVSVKTNEGTMAASQEGTIKLPSDFPSDIFIYPDAKITFSTSTPANATEGTKASFMIAYSTNQSVADVVAKYNEEMVKNGWTKGTESNYGGMMIDFKKGNRGVFLTISDSGGDKAGITSVSITSSEN